MEKYSLYRTLNDSLESHFGRDKLEFRNVEFGGLEISSFFYNCENEQELKEKWNKVSNFIALHFQSKLENITEKWNFYFFYICNFKVSNALKYKIENDTFSSRKIVLEKNQPIKEIIEEHIINKLDLSKPRNIKSIKEIEFKKNVLYDELIIEFEIGKRKDSDARDAFQKLVEIWKIN